MKQPITMHQSPRGPVLGVDINLDDIGPWTATPAGVRDAVMQGHVVGAHLGAELLPKELVQTIMPSQDEVERISDQAEEAIRAGRLIDFEHWTNEVIKHGGQRGGPLYTRGALTHPFRDMYLFMHRWDEGQCAVYLVNPLEPEKAAGDFESVELQPMLIGGNRVLAIGDRMMLLPNSKQSDDKKYHCGAIPAIWRYLPGADITNNGMPPENAAAGNVLDPCMTALLILNTRGIDRETVAVNDKLQRARAKNGKPPIPPYQRVNSEPYITAIEAKMKRRPKRDGQGGTHASPVAHLRMGHPRNYADGKVVLVRDALVNFDENARKAWLKGSRSHYVIKSQDTKSKS